MSYRESAKSRKIKRSVEQFFSFISLKKLSMSLGEKIIIIGLMINFFALFQNWFSIYDSTINGSSFHSLLGLSGYIFILINLSVFFLIISNNKKEYFKKVFHIHIKDQILIFFLILFGIILTTNTIFIISNFEFFKQGVSLGKGVSLAFVGYCLGIIGILFHFFTLKKEFSIYIEKGKEDIQTNTTLQDDKNNMKLPF